MLARDVPSVLCLYGALPKTCHGARSPGSYSNTDDSFAVFRRLSLAGNESGALKLNAGPC